MATFNKTITNSLRVFGPDRPSLWQSANWGVLIWGYTQDVKIGVMKVIGDSLHVYDQFIKSPTKVFSFGSVSGSFEMASEKLSNGGWNYLFVDPTIEAEDRNIGSWAAASPASETWTSGSVTSITWSAS